MSMSTQSATSRPLAAKTLVIYLLLVFNWVIPGLGLFVALGVLWIRSGWSHRAKLAGTALASGIDLLMIIVFTHGFGL
jgi:hypothetical protein